MCRRCKNTGAINRPKRVETVTKYRPGVMADVRKVDIPGGTDACPVCAQKAEIEFATKRKKG